MVSLQKMRIIHFIDYFQPRFGYQETFLAREHARSGHDVCVVTSDRYSPVAVNIRKKTGRMVGPGLRVEEGINVWRLKTGLEMTGVVWLHGLEDKIRELKPDLVIVHGIASLSSIRLARLKNKSADFKLVYDDHMTYTNSLSRLKVLYPLFRWFFSPAIQKAADALVAVVPDTRLFMQRRYGIPPERVKIIPLGADADLFRANAKARREVRRELNIGEDDTVFIYTGKIIPEKRLQVLVAAATGLMKEHYDIKVLLVGSEFQPYMEGLQQDIRESRLSDRFIWHEAVPNEQLYRYYSAADAAVWPYGASIGMREAIACGLPIIIGENSLVTELVDNRNGFTFRESDTAGLKTQMEKLLNRALRKTMGGNSRRLIEERFSWGKIAEEFINLVSVGDK